MRQQFWHTCTLAMPTAAKTQRQNKCYHHHVSAIETKCNTHMRAHIQTREEEKIYIKFSSLSTKSSACGYRKTQDLKQSEKKKKSLLYSKPNQRTVEIHIQRNWNTVGMSEQQKTKL